MKLPRRHRAADLPKKHVVYVHGICWHRAGYSDPWWKAMKRYVPSVTSRHEVVWSDLVSQPKRAVRDARWAIEKQAITDVLIDRAEREVNDAVRAMGGAVPRRGLPVEARAIVQTPGFLDLPGIACIDDFLTYAHDQAVRDKVIDRFTGVVRPLLDARHPVEIISHSWGSVVAYEGLRKLDREAPLKDDVVYNFFTVGSALSIPTVRRWLRSTRSADSNCAELGEPRRAL